MKGWNRNSGFFSLMQRNSNAKLLAPREHIKAHWSTRFHTTGQRLFSHSVLRLQSQRQSSASAFRLCWQDSGDRWAAEELFCGCGSVSLAWHRWVVCTQFLILKFYSWVVFVNSPDSDKESWLLPMIHSERKMSQLKKKNVPVNMIIGFYKYSRMYYPVCLI